ncbi:MAG TPA: hypothetical protein VMU82_08410 [Acetobacteraceae bacterium]|nr:hypothetical protein [Acetobacteraceae bacterium]
MLRTLLATAALIGLAAGPALAQSTPMSAYNQGSTGLYGGHEPMSNQASNINSADTRTPYAPQLPTPPVSPNAGPRQLLMAAQSALQSNQTGMAQEALERAETAMLTRSVPPSQANRPAGGSMISRISAARQALGNGDIAMAQSNISAALSMPRRGMRQPAAMQNGMQPGAMQPPAGNNGTMMNGLQPKPAM